jgi:predicted amidohydrolase
MDKKNRLKRKLMVSAIQMNSGPNQDDNMAQVKHLVGGLGQVPDILVLPEVFNYRSIGNHDDPYSESLNGPSVQFLKALAIEKKMHIIGGSITETTSGNKAYNTTVVINDAGEIMGTYRKMHLFDVSLDNAQILESNRFKPGSQPLMVSMFGWKIGFAICYDLRFPELFRYYFKESVDIVVVPSSFTYETGQKHWHILNQARAIENQCYIIAPNQCGIGANATKTFGHSMIVAPSGQILAEADDKSVMGITHECDKETMTQLRQRFPIKSHQRVALN